MIHSADSLKLLIEINREAIKVNRIIPCLLQFYIATEETKYGLDLNEAIGILNSEEYKSMKNISIAGVMGMASMTDDNDLIDKEFSNLNYYFHFLKTNFFENNPEFKELSMGMSGDYKLAIKHGSTLIRIGSAIFGDRNY